MKVHILYKFIDGPYGGGNQFLKALKKIFEKKAAYSSAPHEANVVLLNGFPTGNLHFFTDAIRLNKEKHIPIFYRLDGLFHRNRLDDTQIYIDQICREFANHFCDGIIYQTDWVKEIQQDFGIDKSIKSITAINAPDSEIFKRKQLRYQKNRKIKLISTCWAPNKRKGFALYQWLDKNLDFNKYEFIFVGNSPIQFDNITCLAPVPSTELSKILAEQDLFISAAFDEPCSNSLIEAMHVGLPAIGHSSGGTPEIIGKGGELFNDETDILSIIDKVATDLDLYHNAINLPTIDEIGLSYLNFLTDPQTVVKPISEEKLLELEKLLKDVPNPQLHIKSNKNIIQRVIRRLLKIISLRGLK